MSDFVNRYSVWAKERVEETVEEMASIGWYVLER